MLTPRKHMYEVYGLTISSEFEMKELKPSDGVGLVDVTIEFADLGLLDARSEHSFSFGEDRQEIILPTVAAFVIIGLDRVLVEPKQGVSIDLLAVPFLGPVLAILLHMRRQFILHGSAIRHNGKAFGFVGDKGAGKSTLAAMLLKNQGVQLLTDDLLVVSDDLEVLCGYLQLKLSDEAVSHSDQTLASVRPPPIEEFPKNQVLLNSYGNGQSVPLGGIHELRRGSEAKVEDVPMVDAIRILLRFSYISRFSKRVPSDAEKRDLFQITTKIAATGCVKRIYVPDDIGALDQVLDVLE